VTDHRAYLLVLMSGEAGLRLGEMVALEWNDIDFVKRQMCVQRSAWKGQVASPKSGRLRYTYRSRRDSQRPFGIIVTFAGRWYSTRTTDLP
jgi:integrase